MVYLFCSVVIQVIIAVISNNCFDSTEYVICCISVGFLSGHKIVGVRMILEDGVAHLVDSSELAFKLAARGAMRTFFFEVRR